MRKKLLLIPLALLLAISLIAIGCPTPPPTTTPPTTTPPTTTPPPEPPKPVELTLAHMFPPGSAEAQIYEQWAEKINNDSNGLLTIRIYPVVTLLSPPEIYSGVVEGVADMGSGFVYKPEDFELSVAHNFLLSAPDTVTAGLVYEDVWKQFPEAMANEWKDVKILWLYPSVPQYLCLISKKVQTLDDMKGLQIRVPSAELGGVMTAWNATPTFMSSSDLAIALEKGTIDGCETMFSAIKSYQWSGTLDYVVKLNTSSLGVPTPVFVVMNKNSYNQLHPDLQKVIDDSLEWGKQASIETWSKLDADGEEYFKSGGGEIISLSPEEEAKWVAILNNAKVEYAQTLDAKGLPGTELLNFINERIEYYAEH